MGRPVVPLILPDREMRMMQGVQQKVCFFTIHYIPSLAYIAVRDLQGFQRNASVFSHLLAGNFLYNQSRVLGKKSQYPMNTLYIQKKTSKKKKTGSKIK